MQFPWICTLQIETIHSMRHLWRFRRASSREHPRIHLIWTTLICTSFLLLNQSLRIWVFYSLLESIFWSAAAPLGDSCRAGLTRCLNHATTCVEHLELSAVVMTQITVFLILSWIRFWWVGRATRTLILHCSQHVLIHEHLLRTCPLPHIVRANMTPGNGRDLRGRRR